MTIDRAFFHLPSAFCRSTVQLIPVLGIDSGRTKTVCVLANEHAHVLAESRGPGANLKAAGERGVETILRQVIDETLGHPASELAAVCVGMAGVDRPQEATAV